MKRTGKTFSCSWLLIHGLFNKRTVPLGENSCKRNYCIDGKHSVENFDTVAGKTVHAQENTVKSHSSK